MDWCSVAEHSEQPAEKKEPSPVHVALEELLRLRAIPAKVTPPPRRLLLLRGQQPPRERDKATTTSSTLLLPCFPRTMAHLMRLSTIAFAVLLPSSSLERACAGEAGGHAGRSGTGRIGRDYLQFTDDGGSLSYNLPSRERCSLHNAAGAVDPSGLWLTAPQLHTSRPHTPRHSPLSAPPLVASCATPLTAAYTLSVAISGAS
jgi:hypothetical protein